MSSTPAEEARIVVESQRAREEVQERAALSPSDTLRCTPEQTGLESSFCAKIPPLAGSERPGILLPRVKDGKPGPALRHWNRAEGAEGDKSGDFTQKSIKVTIRTLFGDSCSFLGVLSGFAPASSLLFQDILVVGPLSGRLKVVILDGIGHSENRPIRRQESQLFSDVPQPGPRAASGRQKLTKVTKDPVLDQE